ncbi:MAG: arginine--tRNA ligase [Puniceicoccales bacterium]|jgi:arginyl-tRNA synthetase|nr:arginine--tRNA ligase [Puniceicoccales bacterium]
MEIWFNPARELELLLHTTAGNTPGFGDQPFDPEIRPSDPRFGDYQANGILAHAKATRANPRALAATLVEALKKDGSLDDALISIEIAGPGFINFQLKPAFLDAWLTRYANVEAFRSECATLYAGRKIIVDYPSPNTAKQMHVGHLRPMVIGEAIARMLQFCGAKLVRDNHIGDWGTNFGILIFAIKHENAANSLDSDPTTALEILEQLYKKGSALAKDNPAMMEAARQELVNLQTGDPENTALWQRIVAISNAAFQQTYEQLGIRPDITLGESFYRDKVERVYTELHDCQLAEESDGALVVWHDEHPRFARNSERPQPFIVRKKDGSSNYASTDLATILYRTEHFQADECIYITDGRQQDHFQQLFLTAEKWFHATGRRLPSLRHVWFGTILGEDGRAIKTKSGDPVRLKTLLHEAATRATVIIDEKNPGLPEDERQHIAHTVGIAAIRYADLSQNRTLDYAFSWEKLLAFDGNTAPYLLYAVARIHSIFRKAAAGDAATPPAPLETTPEVALARKLTVFPSALVQACTELRPHFLCTYLYELAGAYSTFNNADKVLVDEPTVRARRLRLCARTVAVLSTGMRLLGIEPLERM